ncbi:MAG: hypothetical protein D3904_02175 [Candidatus Electrothrix sp. EH2]|nr:hypothetical protein [Candidatus Electrothrix sp. EH2]
MKKSYFESKYFCGILSTILCLFTQLSFGSGCPAPDQCWTTQDVIDERIDVYAQKALLEMFSNGGNEAAAASSMLYAVKCEQLDGIYLPNQQVPALRAQGYGGYWTIFQDTSDNSRCYKKTSKPTQKPIIVFRERIKSDRQAMSRALRDAWYQCQIPITEARCYAKNLPNNPPTGEVIIGDITVTPGEGEGEVPCNILITENDIKHWGNACVYSNAAVNFYCSYVGLPPGTSGSNPYTAIPSWILSQIAAYETNEVCEKKFRDDAYELCVKNFMRGYINKRCPTGDPSAVEKIVNIYWNAYGK